MIFFFLTLNGLAECSVCNGRAMAENEHCHLLRKQPPPRLNVNH